MRRLPRGDFCVHDLLPLPEVVTESNSTEVPCNRVLTAIQIIMRLGLVLRKWRVVSELTLREVAGEIGIGYATLLRIEQGEDVDGRTLIRVAAWLTEKIQAKA